MDLGYPDPNSNLGPETPECKEGKGLGENIFVKGLSDRPVKRQLVDIDTVVEKDDTKLLLAPEKGI